MLTDDQVERLKGLVGKSGGLLDKYLTDPLDQYHKKMEVAKATIPEWAQCAVDIGCGIPYLLHCYRDMGVQQVFGFDKADQSISAGTIMEICVYRQSLNSDLWAFSRPPVHGVVSMHRLNVSRMDGSERWLPELLACRIVGRPGRVVISQNTGEPDWLVDVATWKKYAKSVTHKTGRADGAPWHTFDLE